MARGLPRESDDISLEDWMERYIEGEKAAFEQIYQQLSPRLFGYLLRLTQNQQRAEDLVQITFTKIHKARESYLKGAPLLPWALAIARRSFFDERRRAKVRPEDLSLDGSTPEPPHEPTALGTDMADALEQALQRLPLSYAEAIQLTKITGLSIAEAAEVLGTSQAAIKIRVHRGYLQLRKELESYTRSDDLTLPE